MSELIDNRARRIATLKEIIQHLHKGEAPDAVKGSCVRSCGRRIPRRLWPWSRN